jgi:hypothetical protein
VLATSWCAGAPARAQALADDAAAADTVAADSLLVPLPAAAPDTTAAPRAPGFWSRPSGVMLRSLIVPGWGQATNGQWIKAGVVFAAEAALVAGMVADTQRIQDLEAGDPERSRAFDDRQAKTWWLGGVVFLSMVDAYVSAHLRDVEIEAEPALDSAGGPAIVARVAVRLP